jgi:3-oxoacyl-[acyl-carrier protein] reductase
MSKKASKGAIVTGASGGIGRAVATRLAADGFAVALSYAGNPAKAAEAVKGIQDAGGEAYAVRADVAGAADVDALFRETAAKLATLDAVVHCAGIMPLGAISDGDVGMFDKVIATNLRGTFLVLAQAARRVASGGRIVVFSSSVLAKSFPTYGAYIASKAGVEGLVHVLANELRGKNITVNAVAPGPVATDLFLAGKSKAQIDELGQLAPLGRLGQSDDIASVVSFLTGPGGGWINSQVLLANGGFAY